MHYDIILGPRVTGHMKGEMRKGGALGGEEERIKNTKNV